MSRIHEALQRAYLERGKMSNLAEIPLNDPESIPVLEPIPVAKSEIIVEDIPRHAWKPSLPSLPTLMDRGTGVEQFRSLRSHIYQSRYETPLKTILVASGMPSEGKSFVAANLAMSLARNSIHNILLIDGDLRRPTLHDLLGAPNTVGLTDYLEGSAEIGEILQRDLDHDASGNGTSTSISNLTFISSGKRTDHSSELVANIRMKELISSVSPYFDWIVIDAPPVLAVTDGVELARAADAVLLVARTAITPYEVAQRAMAAFSNSRVLGFVLNDVKEAPRGGAYSYNYNYYYRSEPEKDGSAKRSQDNGR
jgi:capsular exopolysaccharide synthesis family protein